MEKIDQNSIRRQNLTRIIDVLLEHQPVTRQEIARRAELSLMSVTNLVEHLNRYDALSFSEAHEPGLKKRVGRKAEWVTINTRHNAWLILDFMSPRFRFAVMNLDRTLRETGSPWLYRDERGFDANLQLFLQAVAGHLSVSGGDFRIIGVVAAVPGSYDPDRDAIVNTRIPQLNGIRIRELLRTHLGDYPVFVDGDVKLAARAFAGLRMQEAPSVAYYLYIGEGVSGAILNEGRIVRGLNSMAGEAGQILSPGGQTYEDRLCTRAFAQRMMVGIAPGLEGDSLPDSPEELSRRYPQAYARALDDMAGVTAELMREICWMVDPNAVVIDCQWARGHQAEFVDRVATLLGERMRDSGKVLPRLSAAGVGVSSIYLGAAELLREAWIAAMT